MHRLAVTLAAVLAIGLGLPPHAAEAAQCPPPGGVDLGWANPQRQGDFHVVGRGWGHGVGMSQHGAQGAAKLGCTVGEILGTYYPGTAIGTFGDRDIRVGLFTRDGGLPQEFRVRSLDDPIPWHYVNGGSQFLQDQAPGQTWTVRVSGNGTLSVHHGNTQVFTAPQAGGRLEARLGGGDRMVRLPDRSDRRYRFGTVEFRPDGSAGRMFVGVVVPSIERYLYGLAEMPSGWETEALKAQAITGRSYAQVRRGQFRQDCQCHVLDTAADQVYVGHEKEAAALGDRWVNAVNATAQQILAYDGRPVAGYYSSSHGGQSERLTFSSFFNPPGNPPENPPYLQPVDDSRWEQAAPSRVTRWSETYSREQLTGALAHLGVGTVQSVRVRGPLGAGGRVGNPDRTGPDGQRYGGVEIVGSDRALVGSDALSGLEFLRALENGPGLRFRSELFRILTGEASCLPTASQDGNTVVTRSSGPHRVATAAAVSADHWQRSTDAVLATSINFPDALTAGALAARLGAPVLLTRGSMLDPEPRAELERLGVERVHLLGGTAALSAAVEQTLRDDGYEVRRIAGPSRFDTARAAALAAGPSETGEVALAYGGDWPDAVTAGALSGGPDRIPTLLSEREAVPQVTMRALEELDAERVVLIGGSAVLTGAGVGDQLRAAGYEVVRLSGPSRYATSVAVAADAAGRAGGDRPVVLATGQDFPDALAAGGLTARLSSGLVLVTRCDLASIPETLEHLEDGPYERGVIAGGTAAVSDLVREQATSAIERDG